MDLVLPRSILLDLDDTIIGNEFYKKECWQILAREFSGLVPDIDLIVMKAQEKSTWFWSNEDRHRKWRQHIPEARRRILSLTLKDMSRDDDGLSTTIADRFTELRNEHMKPFPGAVETLAYLNEREIPLALVTNGSSTSQREKIERFKLSGYFQYIFIEGEHGFGKPDRRAYLEALGRIHARPQESWMIGDKVEWEVIAPQKIGMKGVLVDPREERSFTRTERPFLVIKTLSEIRGYLE